MRFGSPGSLTMSVTGAPTPGTLLHVTPESVLRKSPPDSVPANTTWPTRFFEPREIKTVSEVGRILLTNSPAKTARASSVQVSPPSVVLRMPNVGPPLVPTNGREWLVLPLPAYSVFRLVSSGLNAIADMDRDED